MKNLIIILIGFLPYCLYSQPSPINGKREIECANLKERVRKHMDMGETILRRTEIGSFKKRSKESRYQYKQAIELLETKVELECYSKFFRPHDKYLIVDALIESSYFKDAEKYLFHILETENDTATSFIDYADMFFERYFKIQQKQSYREQLKNNRIIYSCGNTFDENTETDNHFLAVIRNTEILRKEREWKYVTEYLHSISIDISAKDNQYANYHKLLNTYLAEALVKLYGKDILQEFKEVIILKSDLNVAPFFPIDFNNMNNYQVEIKGYKFGFLIHEDILLEEEKERNRTISNLELTRSIRNAIYNM